MDRIVAAFFALIFATSAMAQSIGGSRLTDMPFASVPLSGTELLYIVQLGNSRKITVQQLVAGIFNPLTITDGTHSVNNVNSILFSGATVGGVSPNGTVTITTSAPGITFTDGTHTVTAATTATLSGATVGGSTPNATIAIVSPGQTYTDGTHSVVGASNLTVSGGVIGGTTPNATLTITPGISGITFTDGTHTVNATTQLTVTGGTIGGATPNGTLTIPGTSLAVGSTPVTGGTSGFYLTDNAGVLGNVAVPTPGITVTDGTHTVTGATQITTTGITVGGTTPNSTMGVNYAANSDVWTHTSTTIAINPAVAATSIAPQTFTESAGTFSINFNSGINLELPLVHADCPCTIANPTNVYAGLSGNMTIIQSATGSDTIGTWGTTWKFSGGTKPTLSTAANAIDVLPFYCRTATFCVVTLIGNAQ